MSSGSRTMISCPLSLSHVYILKTHMTDTPGPTQEVGRVKILPVSSSMVCLTDTVDGVHETHVSGGVLRSVWCLHIDTKNKGGDEAVLGIVHRIYVYTFPCCLSCFYFRYTLWTTKVSLLLSLFHPRSGTRNSTKHSVTHPVESVL